MGPGAHLRPKEGTDLLPPLVSAVDAVEARVQRAVWPPRIRLVNAGGTQQSVRLLF